MSTQASNPQEITLTQLQLDAIHYIEQVWFIDRSIPTAERIAEAVNVTLQTVKKWLESEKFNYILQYKGIKTPSPSGVLSAQQLMLVNALLNVSDKRSERQKLEECGVTPQRYAAWRKDPGFLDYMHKRAEQLFQDSGDVAYMSLLRNMQSGNLQATKLYLEMTGKYQSSSRLDVNFNLENFLVKLIEVLQARIKDPQLLEQLAQDIEAMMEGRPVVVDQRSLPEPIPAHAIEVPVNPPVGEPSPFTLDLSKTLGGFGGIS